MIVNHLLVLLQGSYISFINITFNTFRGLATIEPPKCDNYPHTHAGQYMALPSCDMAVPICPSELEAVTIQSPHQEPLMMKRENSNQPGVEGGFGIFASGGTVVRCWGGVGTSYG